MKQVSSALAHHLAGELTTLATVWKLVRRDGLTIGFTDHDADIVLDEGAATLTYRARSGHTRTAIANSDALDVDNLEVESVFDSAAITEADVRAGLWDMAEIEIALVDWAAPENGRLKLRKGTLGEVTTEGPAFRAELRGLVERLSQSIGEVFTPDCRADLGDARCQVNVSALTDWGEVESAASGATDVFTVAASARLAAAVDASADVTRAERTKIADGTIAIGLFSLVPDGTPLNPFVVSTPSGLDAMRGDDQAWYALEADVDMAGWGLWTPIADFRGGLDGRGHAIRNLDLDHSASAREAGLFETLWQGAHVRRLGLEGFTVRSGSSAFYAAPLAARRAAGVNGIWGTVEDVRSVGCSVVTDGDRAGGLIGLVDTGGAVRRCFAANTIDGTAGTRVGGLIGYVETAGGGAAQEHLLFDSDAAGIAETGANSDAVPAATSAMHDQASYAGFDFETVWRMPASAAYPVLRIFET